MQLRYDDDLLESVILLCAAGKRPVIPALQIRRYHHSREQLYSILDPEERNRAFFKLNAEWFREWRLESQLLDVTKRFSLLEKSVSAVAFRKARTKNDEGAELYVNAIGKHVVVALCAERFGQSSLLEPFLNHELSHVQDMVAPAFGYERVVAGDPAQERLVRERYRLFWDVTIDGRLAANKWTSIGSREMRWQEFQRAFSFWSDAKRAQIFEALWTNPHPRHDELMALAADPRDLAHTSGPIPGALCPLCNFPTFEWCDVVRFSDTIVRLIQREFPSWKTSDGACSRCVDMYLALQQSFV